MKLKIDGKEVVAQLGQSLLDICKQMGIADGKLSDMPIAAKIAGEVFNLNYIPVREKEIAAERPSMRRAMAASNGHIQLLRITDPAGRDVYDRTAQFVIFLALHQLWPAAQAKMGCTVGPALYVEVSAEDFSADRLRRQVIAIVEQNIPLIRQRIATKEAIDHFTANGQEDKAKLLSWRKEPEFDVYTSGAFMDYYYGELAPSTGYLQSWNILPAQGGFFFVYPDELY